MYRSLLLWKLWVVTKPVFSAPSSLNWLNTWRQCREYKQSSHAAERLLGKRPRFSQQKYKESFARLRWLVATKQVPESKNTAKSKTHPRIQNHWDVFWIHYDTKFVTVQCAFNLQRSHLVCDERLLSYLYITHAYFPHIFAEKETERKTILLQVSQVKRTPTVTPTTRGFCTDHGCCSSETCLQKLKLS